MITPEERQEIIDAAVEKALLALPEIVGSLIMNQVNLIKMNKSFYEKYPEFKECKPLVASVLEMVEGQNPGLEQEQLLEKAVPFIRERIKSVNLLDTLSVNRPKAKDRDLSGLLTGNGEL